MCRRLFLIAFAVIAAVPVFAQKKFSHADSLKGAYGPARSWWDVQHYRLGVRFTPADSSIAGCNVIRFSVLSRDSTLQIDLMAPMSLDSVFHNGVKCSWRRDGNAYFVRVPSVSSPDSITTWFHGRPVIAKNPPWDGGVVWKRDEAGNPWVSIACQGMAAQVWFPNKDHMADEVDGASMSYTVPAGLMAVSNGRLQRVAVMPSGEMVYDWKVSNPINNYNIIPYIGKYLSVSDTLHGEGGVLDIAFWMLAPHFQQARDQFVQVKPMLRCFEYWFGRYPFYEDGYKLVEAPFLGMEHQGAIAYGNRFQNGYSGRDLSGTGWGLKWDFIIVHESGHEWFGNNISAKDVADNWIHEGFTAYSENLYTEYLFGREAGAAYVIGTRANIENKQPIIAPYNVNQSGGIDLYYKAANMLHTLRQWTANDSLWRLMLRGINSTFWHRTVTTAEIEQYMASALRLDLKPFFDQYLRTTMVPTLEYKLRKNHLKYRWTNAVNGFNMPLAIRSGEQELLLSPRKKWRKLRLPAEGFTPDPDFYVAMKPRG